MYRNKCKALYQQLLSNFCLLRCDQVSSPRTLYSQAALGVDNYVKTREKIQSQFANMSDKFRSKMLEFIERSNTNMIFTEDLKNMVHLVEKDPTDVTLVIKMMQKFNSQNKELRFGSFVFGPVIMRMFYYLDDPESALSCFRDPTMTKFFDQLMSYQLLLDLLMKHERYDDMISVFESIKDQQIQGARFPKHVVVLAFAACYKQNTPESLKYAITLWSELMEVGHQPMRRAATFLAGLALRQNNPNVALEVVSTVKHQKYMTVRNIKATALADLGRPEDAIPILRSVLEMDEPQLNKQTFTRDAVDKVRMAVDLLNKPELTHEFKKIERLFTEHGHFTENTLDSLLCAEITSSPQTLGQNNNNNYSGRDRNFIAASFQGNQRQPFRRRNDTSTYTRRPGLEDIY